MTQPTRVLLAEDEDIIATLIAEPLREIGCEVTVCADGLAAWACLRAEDADYHVILLDRIMPGMDGIDLLRKIKAEPRLAHTPVIMETALGDDDSIREGLAEGAYYYLTKPFQPEVLVAVVQAAADQGREYRALAEDIKRAERPVAFMTRGEFRFRDLDEGKLIANFLAQACPDPEATVQGLVELLVNAVEHGNLGITYEDKSRLLMEGTWQDEVKRRLALPEYRDRQVIVQYDRQPEAIRIAILDEGAGFDWSDYLDFAPERAFDLHGRGIAMARKLSFSSLEYLGSGNHVVATVLLSRPAGG